MDSNHRPRAYQARALTCWAISPCGSVFPVSIFLPIAIFNLRSKLRLPADACPLVEMMGFEPMTPCLQGRCSPNWATPPLVCVCSLYFKDQKNLIILQNWTTNKTCTSNLVVLGYDSTLSYAQTYWFMPVLHRKEVIQPHLPIRLPCYDLTPIIGPTFDSCLQKVSSLASGVPNFHGLTGGVYKARERIHRGMLIRDY